MPNPTLRNILRREKQPTPGKVVTDSNRFNGHDNRMASHILRARNHSCERTDGKKCPDCTRRKRR